jgi:hypothetical protein
MIESIDVHLDEEMAAEIEKRASALKLSAGTYIALVLTDCLSCAEPETPGYGLGES